MFIGVSMQLRELSEVSSDPILLVGCTWKKKKGGGGGGGGGGESPTSLSPVWILSDSQHSLTLDLLDNWPASESLKTLIMACRLLEYTQWDCVLLFPA